MRASERQCNVLPYLDLRAELRLVAGMVYVLEKVRLRSHFVVDGLGSRLHPRYIVFQLDRLQQGLGPDVGRFEGTHDSVNGVFQTAAARRREGARYLL